MSGAHSNWSTAGNVEFLVCRTFTGSIVHDVRDDRELSNDDEKRLLLRINFSAHRTDCEISMQQKKYNHGVVSAKRFIETVAGLLNEHGSDAAIDFVRDFLPNE